MTQHASPIQDEEEYAAARAALEAARAKDPPAGFTWIDRPCRVTREDFSYEAVCLCSFPKKNGKVRYVIEDHGRIFIQLREHFAFTDGESD